MGDKPNFTQVWTCPRDKSPLIQVKISKFGPKYILAQIS